MCDNTDQKAPSPRVAVGSLIIPATCFPRFALAASAALARARAAGMIDLPPLAAVLPDDDQGANWRARQLAARFRLSDHHARTLAHLGFTSEPRNGER